MFGIGVKLVIGKKPLDHIPNLVAEFNNLTLFASQRAVVSGRVVRLTFGDGEAGGITTKVDELVITKNKEGESAERSSEFVPAKDLFIPVSGKIESSIRISLLRDDKDKESSAGDIVSYFMSTGVCEPLRLQLVRRDVDQEVSAKIALNRFSCKFEVVE